MGDNKVCPICRDLEMSGGWTFELGAGVIPALVDPIHGLVADVAGSHAHKHQFAPCRCTLVPEWNLKDLLETLTLVRDRILAAKT
jgi:hypothetical protein